MSRRIWSSQSWSCGGGTVRPARLLLLALLHGSVLCMACRGASRGRVPAGEHPLQPPLQALTLTLSCPSSGSSSVPAWLLTLQNSGLTGLGPAAALPVGPVPGMAHSWEGHAVEGRACPGSLPRGRVGWPMPAHLHLHL